MNSLKSRAIKALQDQLWAYAYLKPETSGQRFDLNGSGQSMTAEPFPPGEVSLAQADEPRFVSITRGVLS